MLAALIAFQNSRRTTAAAVARKSVGQSRPRPSVDPEQSRHHVMDIMAATATFPEVLGEDPATRALRRLQWISEALPRIKEARERREAAAFMMGAQIADAAAREELAAKAAVEQLTVEQIAQLIKIIDEVRGPAPVQAAPARQVEIADRGRGNGSGLALAIGITIGVVVGFKIAQRRPARRSFRRTIP